jgi:catechol 2,3-dioxygenase
LARGGQADAAGQPAQSLRSQITPAQGKAALDALDAILARRAVGKYALGNPTPALTLAHTMALPTPAPRPLPADSQVRIGHIHLKVADLERSLVFYRDVLGFSVTQRYGRQAVFLSAGGYHHHLGLNTWESAGGSPPPPGTTGLYHVAILYPSRAELADAVRRVVQAGLPLDGAADHGVSEAIYLRDPDSNGVELYWDRPADQWPRAADGGLAMGTQPLDVADLLRSAPDSA